MLSVCKLKTRFNPLLLIFLGMSLVTLAHADYSRHPKAMEFAEQMQKEHGRDKNEILSLLSQAAKKQAILDAMDRPAEKTKAWHEYRDIFLGETRISKGVTFWQENLSTLQRAEKEFGVDPAMIVAIIGVETRYGGYMGSYRVLDALATLGFDYPRRSTFFLGELEHFLLLTSEQKLNPLSLKGSYAGAMGFGQFIPSSYRAYAVDFDGDALADIWENPVDAIGSVANYFKRHGWRSGEPVFIRTRIEKNYDDSLLGGVEKPKLSIGQLKSSGFSPVESESVKTLSDSTKVVPLMYEGEHGKEFWLGFHNYYVITRYNRSRLYAMAAWQLSEEIRRRFEESQSAKNSK